MHAYRGFVATIAAIAVLLGALAGCTSDGTSEEEPLKGPVVIGSKIDTEGELISSIVKVMLEENGFEVEDRSQTGATEVVRKALIAGEIDIYPEYTGSGFWFYGDTLTDDERAAFKDGEAGYELVASLDLTENGIVWLEPARANNTWAIAVREDFAETEDLKTMSDFTEYVKAGKPTKLAASDEFFTNLDANPEFERVYGYALTADQQVRLAGGNTAATEKAVADGTDGVNFGMAYGTDGALADLGLIVLEDDLGAQLVYWPTPIATGEIMEAYPEIADLLKPVMAALDVETLQELNARIQVSGEDADEVARDFLTAGGFIE